MKAVSKETAFAFSRCRRLGSAFGKREKVLQHISGAPTLLFKTVTNPVTAKFFEPPGPIANRMRLHEWKAQCGLR